MLSVRGAGSPDRRPKPPRAAARFCRVTRSGPGDRGAVNEIVIVLRDGGSGPDRSPRPTPRVHPGSTRPPVAAGRWILTSPPAAGWSEPEPAHSAARCSRARSCSGSSRRPHATRRPVCCRRASPIGSSSSPADHAPSASTSRRLTRCTAISICRRTGRRSCGPAKRFPVKRSRTITPLAATASTVRWSRSITWVGTRASHSGSSRSSRRRRYDPPLPAVARDDPGPDAVVPLGPRAGGRCEQYQCVPDRRRSLGL